MKLATKGLLVVSLPLIFQALIVSVLVGLLFQAQELTYKEARLNDIISECNQLSINISEAIQIAFFDNKRPGVLASPSIQGELDFLGPSMRNLRERLGEQPEEAENIKRLSQFTDRFIRQFKIAKKSNASPNNAGFQLRNIPQIRLLITFDHLYRIFEDTIAFENQSHSELPQKREKARFLIRIWLLSAVAASALSALGLAYFSSITISKPLGRMVKNAKNISRRQALEPEVTGSDELAHLDHVLHAVDSAIEEALTKERDLIAYAADLVFSVDRHGIFQSVNPFAESILGFEPEKLVGTSILSVIADCDREKTIQYLSNQYRDGEAVSFEIIMQPRNHNVIDTAWSAIWSQRQESLFCVAHDITERKHIERLKQDFIAMLSHDLRTPLMSVLSSINLVQAGAAGEVSARTESELNKVERSIDHLIELVNDLLDFEKLEAGRMDFDILPISFNEVLDESLRLVQALTEQKRVKIESPTQDFIVAGDQRKLIQVIVNLLSNALKHSPEDGLVQIQTQSTGNMVEISIHDQGPGVPDQYAEIIFTPFEQISERSTAALGTGLGLTICKLLVEGHDGKIGVRNSDLLQGSAFWFTVPTPGSTRSAGEAADQ